VSINYFSTLPVEPLGPIVVTETHPRWWGGVCIRLSQFFLDLAYAKARKVTKTFPRDGGSQ
jgi:hypothetical protein